MKTQVTTIIALTLISQLCFAEIIDGPANVREARNGHVLFSLNDGIRVQSRKLEGDWLEITIPVRVDPRSDFVDSEMNVVKKGTTLRGDQGQTIGVTLDEVSTQPGVERGSDKEITVLIGGYTHRQNVKPNSILESHLAILLREGNRTSIEDFVSHLKDIQYEKWINQDGFITYINFNKPTTDPSPWPRAILFFYEDKLVAVYHERPIASKQLTQAVKIRGDTMSYVTEVQTALRMKLSKIYYPIIENAD